MLRVTLAKAGWDVKSGARDECDRPARDPAIQMTRNADQQSRSCCQFAGSVGEVHFCICLTMGTSTKHGFQGSEDQQDESYKVQRERFGLRVVRDEQNWNDRQQGSRHQDGHDGRHIPVLPGVPSRENFRLERLMDLLPCHPRSEEHSGRPEPKGQC